MLQCPYNVGALIHWWLVARVSGDLSSLEKQVEHRWSTGIDSSGFFGPEEPPLVVHQTSEGGAPASQQPS